MKKEDRERAKIDFMIKQIEQVLKKETPERTILDNKKVIKEAQTISKQLADCEHYNTTIDCDYLDYDSKNDILITYKNNAITSYINLSGYCFKCVPIFTREFKQSTCLRLTFSLTL